MVGWPTAVFPTTGAMGALLVVPVVGGVVTSGLTVLEPSWLGTPIMNPAPAFGTVPNSIPVDPPVASASATTPNEAGGKNVPPAPDGGPVGDADNTTLDVVLKMSHVTITTAVPDVLRRIARALLYILILKYSSLQKSHPDGFVRACRRGALFETSNLVACKLG